MYPYRPWICQGGGSEAMEALEVMVTPFMYQTMLTPVAVFLQRMSGLPSLLKSAVPAIFQGGGTVAMEALEVMVALKELMSMDSALLIQNEANSGSLQDGTSEGLHTLEAGTQTNSVDRIWDYATSWHDAGRNGTAGWLGSSWQLSASPQCGGLGSGGVALRTSTPPSCNPLLNHAQATNPGDSSEVMRYHAEHGVRHWASSLGCPSCSSVL